jgi:hypothetical protein
MFPNATDYNGMIKQAVDSLFKHNKNITPDLKRAYPQLKKKDIFEKIAKDTFKKIFGDIELDNKRS